MKIMVYTYKYCTEQNHLLLIICIILGGFSFSDHILNEKFMDQDKAIENSEFGK